MFNNVAGSVVELLYISSLTLAQAASLAPIVLSLSSDTFRTRCVTL